jgi:hypothetical protein
LPPKKPIPIRRKRTGGEFRAEALKRLKERCENFDPSNEPTVAPILRSAEGGIRRVMEAIRAHDNEDARKFIELYDSLSAKDRQYLKLEEIAVAAGIGSLRLAEVAVSAMILHGQMTSKLTIAASMQKVVKATVKAATDKVPIIADVDGARIVVGHTNGDTKAMEIFGRMSGLVPVPKGAQIAIQTNVTTEKAELQEGRGEPAFLDAGQRLRQIHDAVEGQRRLPSPKSEPIEAGGALDHLQSQTAEILIGRDADDVF